jgi:hypothetical protein
LIYLIPEWLAFPVFKEEEDGKIKVNIIAVDETRETVYFVLNWSF